MTVVATLYRCPNPTDRLCPCGRVARELRAAGFEVDEVRVPWRRAQRDEVEALTGQTRVPVALIDGEPIVDSHRVVEHLRWRQTADGSSPT